MTNISLTPGTSAKIQLSAVGVSSTVNRVLVYVEVGTGHTDKNDVAGQIEIYSESYLKQYLWVHGYIAYDWAYNSDNMWVPIGTERIVYAKYNGNEAITGSCYARMRIIGYQ